RACAFLFFFQAEDGIRDSSVTGVQTCALPISLPNFRRRGRVSGAPLLLAIVLAVGSSATLVTYQLLFRPEVDSIAALIPVSAFRSEERRVGKEWLRGVEQVAGNDAGGRVELRN